MNARQRRTEERLLKRLKQDLAGNDSPPQPPVNNRHRAQPPDEPQKRNFAQRHALSIGAAALIAALTLGGIATRKFLTVDSWINVALLALIPFAMGWAGVYLAAKVLTSRTQKRGFIGVFTTLFIAGIGFAIWQQKRSENAIVRAGLQHRHPLSQLEREGFKHILESQRGDDINVQIACAAADEKACIYATQFINIFGESQWKVRPAVERLTLSRAPDGVTIFRRGGDKQDMMKRWDSGGWFQTNEVHLLAVYKAFHAVGIEINGQPNPDLDENVLLVYVGPEREHESQPTLLTKQIEWALGKRQGPYPNQ